MLQPQLTGAASRQVFLMTLLLQLLQAATVGHLLTQQQLQQEHQALETVATAHSAQVDQLLQAMFHSLLLACRAVCLCLVAGCQQQHLQQQVQCTRRLLHMQLHHLAATPP
jgi:ABC-type Fe3+ transport system permease subunit